MIPLDDPMSLSLLFHLNSEPWLNDRAYRGGGGPQERLTRRGALAEIALPPPEPTALTAMFNGVDRAARSRPCRSRASGWRRFSTPRTASWGRWTCPIPRVSRIAPCRRRAACFPWNCSSCCAVSRGSRTACITTARRAARSRCSSAAISSRGLEPVFYTFPFCADANVIIALAAIFPRSQTKYGPRGYRYVLLESGHVAQNICLRAAELDLATLCMGGFVDSALNARLGLKAPYEGVVYTIAARRGRGTRRVAADCCHGAADFAEHTDLLSRCHGFHGQRGSSITRCRGFRGQRGLLSRCRGSHGDHGSHGLFLVY